MENGNLAYYIETNPDTDRSSFVRFLPSSRKRASWCSCSVRLQLRETADAVTYLHSKGIVHGDIKARNILVSGSRHVLLCDFGLAKWAYTVTASASKGMGTARWQSPEVLDGQSRCFASDTYAFGITIAEVISRLCGTIRLLIVFNDVALQVLGGDIPFNQFRSWSEAAIIKAVLLGQRPWLKPTHSPTGKPYQPLWNIATSCWMEQPSSRPEMAKVLASLRSFGELDFFWRQGPQSEYAPGTNRDRQMQVQMHLQVA